MSRDGEVILHEDPPGPVLLGAGRLGQRVGERRRLDARGPQHGPASYRVSLPSWSRTSSPPASTLGDDRAHVQLDAEPCPVPARLSATARARTPPAARWPPSNSSTRASSGLVCRYSCAQRLGGELADLPGQLDAGRARRRPGRTSASGAAPPGRSPSRPSRTRRRPGAGWSARRRWSSCPARARRTRRGRSRTADPGRDDQVVVARHSIRSPPGAAPITRRPLGVDAGDLGHDALDVPVLARAPAQRRGDLPLGQDAGRALVEQRLEQVVLRRGRSA